MMTRDYSAGGLRIEYRPAPQPGWDYQSEECTMADAGVHAHWTAIVDQTGSPLFESKVFPISEQMEEGNEQALHDWIDAIHNAGMAAMTWFPGTHCKTAAQAHPDWKVALMAEIAPWGGAGWNLCINTGYGDALIEFVKEAVGGFDLDGFWFDGAILTGTGNIGCCCDVCREKFKAETGLEFPARLDWSDQAFREWVRWRYRVFPRYWSRLAAEVRRQFPCVRICVNHLHRTWGYSWHTGMPLNPFPGDIVTGCESLFSPFISAFHSRFMRAYEKPESEVWMGLHKLHSRGKFWPAQSEPINRFMHHALACMTAGAMPSFGSIHTPEQNKSAYSVLAGLINPRRPFTGGKSIPYAALHLSQQTETFVYSRRTEPEHPQGFWLGVLGWHNLLIENHLLTDVVFDAHLAAQRLSAYAVVIAPLSAALSDRQAEALHDYVRRGGVLVATTWLGSCDEGGEAADPSRMQALLGRKAAAPPSFEDEESRRPAVEVRSLGKGYIIIFEGTVGHAFYHRHSKTLAHEVGNLIEKYAPPALTIEGPPRLHVGLYERPGRLLLHLHNFIAYSEAESFPNPILVEPEPIEGIKVSLKGFPVRSVRPALAPDAPPLPFERNADTISFEVCRIERGEVLQMSF